ncbi:lytic transglycosylase domain-containing protein [Chelatococcus sp. SYSU_G07232]|uniref:Lytic transglycosylase domain-containing protein n=1 Tax=Chelatococcus albus TaxID=3047466 RepID=A0ABT7AJX0_9HYPH|nr:lytic transglycosylase domain-containing protein [Chelatococcus sp. SYSU_G07232]MDJ1159664.1 lytic transglycosylase domain-containing protein [Chelatococcus sp. SYSU_G07232]
MKPLTRLLASTAFVTLAVVTACAESERLGWTLGAIPSAESDEVTGSLPQRNGGAPRDASGARLGSFDMEQLKQAIACYRDGDIVEGDKLAATIRDPAARGLLEWVAIRHNGAALGFARITTFLREHPGWPAATTTRRRAEEALLKEARPAATVRSYLSANKPVSAAGKVALALALKEQGVESQATALVREAWREDALGKELEDRIREEFRNVLTRADHRQRMERLLFKGEWEAALRVAAFAGPDHVLLAKARVAVGRKAGNAAAALDAVPASLRSDPSYLFARAQYLRRQDKPAEAAKVLADVPRDAKLLVDGDEWWTERRIIARALLDDGDARAAYRVARDHAAESDANRIEAEFHAGWIALRFLDDPATAARHFASAAKFAETPISVARAAYWQGRAAEELKNGDARHFYERAAKHAVTYYGQLARMRLGLRDVPLRRAPDAGAAANAALERLETVRAIRIAYQADMRDLAIPLFADLAQRLAEPAQLDALADIAVGFKDARALLLVGKTAVQRGYPLDTAAFPTMGLPSFQPAGEPVEKPMVFAIARQESAFDPKVVSSAGARGLMQLMPATAKRTASRFGIGFDVNKLTSDPSYNARIGATHLGELVEEWKGSYILTFAAYNAGSANVRKWIAAYGDPRSGKVDPVDWVERIPFSETRNYVQRVMENLQVYRHRLGQRTALLIESDLRRGSPDR